MVVVVAVVDDVCCGCWPALTDSDEAGDLAAANPLVGLSVVVEECIFASFRAGSRFQRKSEPAVLKVFAWVR